MKAISIQQPFAALIATGQKRLETRTWQTDYRGPLLICAGAKSHSLLDFYDFQSEILGLRNNSAKSRFHVEKKLAFTFGKAICVVDMVGIRPFKKGNVMENDACCDWYPGSFAWELENPRLIEPFEVKGKLRLFEVADELIKYL
jgi:hypothetical protein